jgi:dUTP pyrophosphatase
MRIRISRLPSAKDLPLPKYHSSGAVAFDFFATEDTIVSPKTVSLIPTGLVIEVPKGYALLVCSRSSTPLKKSLSPPHGLGIIDHDYCGKDDEIKIQVRNFSDLEVLVQKGERIAQGLFVKIDQAEWEEFVPNEENRGGFGSTAGYN